MILPLEMHLTNSTTVQYGAPGHPTSGCDPKDQLDGTSDGGDDGDDCTNGLLRGRLGGDVHEDGSEYATNEAQNRGQSTLEKESYVKSRFGSTAVLPLFVSLFKLNYTRSHMAKHHKVKRVSVLVQYFLIDQSSSCPRRTTCYTRA